MGTTDPVSRGERLRRLREDAGELTPEEVARQANLDPEIVSDLEGGTGTRRLMAHAAALRGVLGDEITRLVGEEEVERSEALGRRLRAVQMAARLEQAASEFVVEGYPSAVVVWTGNPEEAAALPERLAEHRRQVLAHNREKAAGLTPAMLAALAGVRLGPGDEVFAEAVCARWREILADLPDKQPIGE